MFVCHGPPAHDIICFWDSISKFYVISLRMRTSVSDTLTKQGRTTNYIIVQTWTDIKWPNGKFQKLSHHYTIPVTVLSAYSEAVNYIINYIAVLYIKLDCLPLYSNVVVLIFVELIVSPRKKWSLCFTIPFICHYDKRDNGDCVMDYLVLEATLSCSRINL